MVFSKDLGLLCALCDFRLSVIIERDELVSFERGLADGGGEFSLFRYNRKLMEFVGKSFDFLTVPDQT